MIWKFPLTLTNRQIVRMPKGARVLTVMFQQETVCLWARVAPDAEPTDRTFWIFGTGHAMPRQLPLVYVGSVQQPPYVWHVYEENLGSALAEAMGF